VSANAQFHPGERDRGPFAHLTWQRRVILQALAEASEFVGAQDLHARLRLAGQRIGLNTIYRALNALVGADQVDVVHDPTAGQLFRLRPGWQHEHYLRCRSCGYSVTVTSDLVEHWADAVADEHGFTNVHHVIELTGQCGHCAPKRQT
jgi:Fur family transcriptional regulator, ferric uptake regulator